MYEIRRYFVIERFKDVGELGEIGRIRFNGGGRRLAVGFRERGTFFF